MFRYDKKLECFSCPKCGDKLREFEEGFIIQAFECIDCNLIFDSYGRAISEQELKELEYPKEDD